MADPSLALQKGVVDRLRTDPAVAALVGLNVFDRVPTKRDPFPRITIGRDQIIDDGDACGDGWLAVVTVHVWTREPPGMAPAKAIAVAVRDALASTDVDIEGFRLLSALHRDSVYLDDPDGLTSHVAVTFDYLIDPAE